MTNYSPSNISEPVKLVPLLNKDVRSKIIKKYLGDDKCFCFSCGNAVDYLRKHKVNVIGVSDRDLIKANKEINVYESKEIFGCFNATSGNLPVSLMYEISKEIKKKLPKEMFQNNKKIIVPMGSGETLFCLSFLFPIERLIGVYGDNPHIKYDMTPLMDFIDNNFIIRNAGKVKDIKDIIDVLLLKNCYFIDTEPHKKR